VRQAIRSSEQSVQKGSGDAVLVDRQNLLKIGLRDGSKRSAQQRTSYFPESWDEYDQWDAWDTGDIGRIGPICPILSAPVSVYFMPVITDRFNSD
jgi:hypothetical protein